MVQEICLSLFLSLSLSLSLFPFPEDQRNHSHLLVHSARGVGFSETFLFTRASLAAASASIKPRTMDSTSSSNSNAPHHRAILSSRHRRALTTRGNKKILSNVSKQPTHPANTARPVHLARQIVPRYVPLVVRRFTRLLCRLRLSPTGLAALLPCAEKRLASNGTHQVRIRAIERPGEIRAVVVEAGPKSREHLRGGAQ